MITPAIQALRDKCNEEIKLAALSAYRNYSGGPIINPPIPFVRFNEMLKLCDAVFRECDK